jgi:hypothetical protein
MVNKPVSSSNRSYLWLQVLFAACLFSTTNAYAQEKIMVFGGRDHKTYLGCLSCSEYASDSVFNEYGSFGNEYSSTSIFNQFSEFGSEYSMYSACNQYASDPPVVVDKDGNYYGRLTVNVSNPQQVKAPELTSWLVQKVCHH